MSTSDDKNETKETKSEEKIEMKSSSLFRNKADVRTLFIIAFTWVIFCINWFFIYEIKITRKYNL